jgi:hypothetical protein
MTNGNLYEDPSLFRWAGSLEGVPAPSPTSAGSTAPGRTRLTLLLDPVGLLMPGVAMAGLLALGSRSGSQWLGGNLLGFERSPISPMLFAILLGLAIRNLVGLPAS